MDCPFTAYRHLAMRVLARALRDMSDPAGSASDRESARVFFAGSPMLFHWCRVAELDPSAVARNATRVTGQQGPQGATAPARSVAPERTER